MNSCIYEGVVRHERMTPSHSFRYSLFMMYLDLAELDSVFRGRWLWSIDRMNIASFNRAYHLGDPSLSLEDAVRELVAERIGKRPDGPIRMLTQLRYFGHNFNPVSFYYCFDKEGVSIQTIVVEIHNTPWGEIFCYVLGEDQTAGFEKEKKYRLSKRFHISPFFDMDIRYQWEFSTPETSLHVLMTSYEHGEKSFQAGLSMKRREITGGGLARMLIKYPIMNIKIIGAIYWQAFRLWKKGATFYTHPSKRTDPPESLDL